jgi:uncharacterized protein YtpQ (UPF0354 family)
MTELPAYIPKRDMPLGEAYSHALDLFREADLTVVPHARATRHAGLHGFIRAFETPVAEGETVAVFVCTEPWTKQRSLAFVNEYAEVLLEGSASFHFITGYPLSPMLDYIFAPWPAGKLEADALMTLGDKSITVRDIGDLAELGRRLLKTYFGTELDLDEIGSISLLNKLVLSDLRPCDDPTLALEPGVYLPSGILAILGSVLGEIIRRAHTDQVEWVEAPEAIGGDYPVLELRMDSADENNLWYVFPFDKILQIYQNGQDRDLRTYYDVVISGTLSGEGLGAGSLDDFEMAADRLLPVLKPASWASAHKVEGIALIADGPIGTPMVAVAIDHPRQIAFVIKEKLDKWEVDFPELMGRSCANLARMTTKVADHLEELDLQEIKVWRLSYDDYFNASRILLAESVHKALKTVSPESETFLVAVPNRDHLLATAVQQDEDRAAFQNVVLWFHERQPAPISSVCFLLGGDGIIGYYGIVPNA